jgi:antitoxin ParD1/3/4
MDVHLSPDVERIVTDKLRTGRYKSASDVVDEAIRLLEERDEISKRIDQGLKSLEKGQGLAEEEAFAELQSRHEEYKHTKRE